MSVRIVRDVVYKQIDGVDLHLDLHIPENVSTSPVIVYFHGGGFAVGSRSDLEAERAGVLASWGFTVVTVQYRFIDVAIFPAQLDDARSAIEWVREHAAEYGYNADKIGAWGASAGGTLSTLLALGTPTQSIAPSVDASVSWFAALDIDSLGGGSELEKMILAPDEIEGLFGGPYDKNNEIQVAADSARQVSGAAAPLFLITGDRDRVMEAAQSHRLHDALVIAGATVNTLVVGGAGHESDVFQGTAVIGATAAFFAEHLGLPA